MRARSAASEYRAALNILAPRSKHWSPPVLTISGLANEGLDDLWAQLGIFKERMQASGDWESKRAEQQLAWMWGLLNEKLQAALMANPDIKLHCRMLSARLSLAICPQLLLLVSWHAFSRSEQNDGRDERRSGDTFKTCLLGAGVVAGAGALVVSQDAQAEVPAKPVIVEFPAPRSQQDVSVALQAAMNRAAENGHILQLGAGTYSCSGLSLPNGLTMRGVPGQTRLVLEGGGSLLKGSGADHVHLSISPLTVDTSHLQRMLLHYCGCRGVSTSLLPPVRLQAAQSQGWF